MALSIAVLSYGLHCSSQVFYPNYFRPDATDLQLFQNKCGFLLPSPLPFNALYISRKTRFFFFSNFEILCVFCFRFYSKMHMNVRWNSQAYFWTNRKQHLQLQSLVYNHPFYKSDWSKHSFFLKIPLMKLEQPLFKNSFWFPGSLFKQTPVVRIYCSSKAHMSIHLWRIIVIIKNGEMEKLNSSYV